MKLEKEMEILRALTVICIGLIGFILINTMS